MNKMLKSQFTVYWTPKKCYNKRYSNLRYVRARVIFGNSDNTEGQTGAAGEKNF